ncbi:DUF5777 family beta-barrel protein [Paraflavisolibacter sp. H34]|uniref:DUF5777 family beta-barrel protein n=1 Tax=Huijunlia imazamoxiresistens TaxID=3127457 RepID=UPI0030159FFC
MQKYFLFLFLFAFSFVPARSQDTSLLKMLDDSLAAGPWADQATGTFKATQIINTPTVEAPGKKGLQFLIMHRFGKLNEGGYALFGLDNATIRFGLDYGLTDRLAVGIGRSQLDKTFDGSLKWKVLRQAAGKVPITVSLYGLLTHYTLKMPDKPYLNARYRTAYTTQALIARKFNRNLSLQLSPAWTHFNLVPTPQDNNEVFSLGIGGRMKITRRISINAEYNLLPGSQLPSTDPDNSLSLGFDFETGGHVFQLVFTNSQGMTGPYYLAKTQGEWGDGDIYFGFNISRSFSFKKNK